MLDLLNWIEGNGALAAHVSVAIATGSVLIWKLQENTKAVKDLKEVVQKILLRLNIFEERQNQHRKELKDHEFRLRAVEKG